MAELLPLSPVPLYSQLKELLRERILDGTYPPLSRMPSEAELGKAFEVGAALAAKGPAQANANPSIHIRYQYFLAGSYTR